MANRQFKPDLTGSGETLEDLLSRLSSFRKRPVFPKGPRPGRFFSSGRPISGAGGAEAPIPQDKPLSDLYARA